MCISLQSFLYVAVGEWNFVLCTLATEPSSRLKSKVLLKSTTQWLAKDMEKEQKGQKNEAHSSNEAATAAVSHDLTSLQRCSLWGGYILTQSRA